MTARTAAIELFLEHAGWQAAEIKPLAGDASFRRYYRVYRGADQAVLMDAPPPAENCAPFVAIARYLEHMDFKPPGVLAADLTQGFLLLEDLGDDLYARYVERFPAAEKALYTAAVDVLLGLQDRPLEMDLQVDGTAVYSLPLYDLSLLLKEVGLFTDWYLPAVTGRVTPPAVRAEFMRLWRDILADVALPDPHVLVLRDYHAENLLWLPAYKDLKRVGLLDFQDAVIGHRAYDLVSLLQDARRDVPAVLEQQMLVHYILQSGVAEEPFRRDYAVLGAQRNTKIIGIFARLCLRDEKKQYLDLLPRVWGLLQRDLQHPMLSALKDWFDEHVPQKTRQSVISPRPLWPGKAMVLAAGLGTRMQPLTHDRPKPLVMVAGRTLLDHSLDQLRANGVTDVVVNMHYKADMMAAFVACRPAPPRITLSDERAALKDSGGGVVQALPYLGTEHPFFVLNSDMIWTDGEMLTLQRLASHWREGEMDVLMLLIPCADAVGYQGAGDFHMEDYEEPHVDIHQADIEKGAAKGIAHHSARKLSFYDDGEKESYVFTGIQMMHPRVLSGFDDKPFSLRRVFENAQEQGRLYGIVHQGDWYHVGTPDMVDKVTAILKRGDGTS
ncbi:MAG: hypothetical protein CMF31_07235 [Kordiimonas sp.]|nr:hypothetical protein [Kordiimonas sp.]|tara:strand:+ start:624 stop:2456 length:1833 start_codon:yes stop_codon:yes gene_type:complete